jgi:hypothetical protein
MASIRASHSHTKSHQGKALSGPNRNAIGGAYRNAPRAKLLAIVRPYGSVKSIDQYE